MRSITLDELATEIEITRRDLAQLEEQYREMGGPSTKDRVLDCICAGVALRGEIIRALPCVSQAMVDQAITVLLRERRIRRVGRGKFVSRCQAAQR